MGISGLCLLLIFGAIEVVESFGWTGSLGVSGAVLILAAIILDKMADNTKKEGK